MNIIKLIVLLTITLTCKSIVFSQNFSNDSLKCFTYSQVRKITAEIKKAEVCDSIIQTQQLQIINYKNLYDNISHTYKLCEEFNFELKKENKRIKLKLSVFNFKVVFPIGLGTGIILGYVISK